MGDSLTVTVLERVGDKEEIVDRFQHNRQGVRRAHCAMERTDPFYTDSTG